jgi:hypothetical protein
MATDEEVRAVAGWISGDLKDGSDRDREARRIFARILRSDRLDMSLRLMLASRIDPDQGDTRLVFKRPRGNQTNKADHRKIAAFIWQRRATGGRFKNAVADAEEKFRVSHGTATNAWKAWKPLFERAGKKIKALTRV